MKTCDLCGREESQDVGVAEFRGDVRDLGFNEDEIRHTLQGRLAFRIEICGGCCHALTLEADDRDLKPEHRLYTGFFRQRLEKAWKEEKHG